MRPLNWFGLCLAGETKQWRKKPFTFLNIFFRVLWSSPATWFKWVFLTKSGHRVRLTLECPARVSFELHACFYLRCSLRMLTRVTVANQDSKFGWTLSCCRSRKSQDCSEILTATKTAKVRYHISCSTCFLFFPLHLRPDMHAKSCATPPCKAKKRCPASRCVVLNRHCH